ncbi:hypothetical protein HYW35_01585 [Candidatus Saccharibacteria bacterium]|nr:hypothetical protein [Candidatus Saccharibacteria bacterium]
MLIAVSRLHHVIYLPGIGDHRPWGQDKIIKLWRIFGVRAQFHIIGWADGEAFEPKLERIGALVDKLAAGGNQVSLVGVSAGASAALNTYMIRKDKIAGVVYVCGKIRNLRGVNLSYYIKNPAFKQSLIMSDANVAKLQSADKHKMLDIRAQFDNIVFSRPTIVPGIRIKKMPIFGHIPGILMAITLYSPVISYFLKKRAKEASV